MENEKPNALFFRFEDLRIYHKALDYASWVYNNTLSSNQENCNPVVTKFLSASQAIAINIAEGSGRNKTQFVYYLKMAKSSIRECIVYTAICKNIAIFSEVTAEDSQSYLIEMTKMLGALIASLQKSEKAAGRSEEFDDDIPQNIEY
jgi:four helix bundle protein